MREYSHKMESNEKKQELIFKLHVSNVPNDVTESKLLALFRKHGNAASVYINNASASGRWALVDYTDYNEATEAIMKLDGVPPYNLCVKLSKKTIDQIESNAKEEARLCGEASEDVKEPILLCRGRGRPVPFTGPPPRLLIPKRIHSSKYYKGENYNYDSESYNINFMDDDLSDQIESISMKVDYIPQSSRAVMRGRGLHQPQDVIDEIRSKISPRYSDKISNAEFTIGPNIHEIPNPNCEISRIKKFENFLSRKGKHVIDTLNDEFDFKINGILGEDSIFASVLFDYEINQDLMSDLNLKPLLGEMVYAMMDSKWYRGYVTFKKKDKIKVALIDVGIVVVPEAISPMPLEAQIIPETAIIITFQTTLPTEDLIGEVVKVKDLEFDDNVYGNCYLGRVEINRWEPTIEDCGVTAVKIPTKNEVFIASFQSPNSLYVYSANPEDVVARMEFAIDLFSYAVESKSLDRKPFFGEILCCRYAEDNRFYRAQVIKKKNDKYIVSFIDYGNISTVSLNDMKPLPEIFKNVPAFAVKIALNGVSGTVFNENSIELLNGFVFDNKKFILEYSHLDNVKLYIVTELHNSLNNELEKLQSYINIKEDFFLMENLKLEKWQIGQKLNLLGVSSLSFKSYLVIDSESPTFNSVKNMTPKINEFCENHKQSMYLPLSNEICLAKFKEKNCVSWCRASFLGRNKTRDFAKVYLVDYGNHNYCFPLSDLRPISPEFLLFPIACRPCEIYGLTDDLSDEVKEAIKNAFTEEAFFGIVVDDGFEIIIYVPAVNEILTTFNLPAITPPKIIAELIN